MSDWNKGRKTISVKEDTHKTLWELKEDSDHTYDEIIRELMREAGDGRRKKRSDTPDP